MTARELKDHLESLEDQARFDTIRRITDAGHETEFGAYVGMALDDLEDQLVASLKRITSGNEVAWNLIGRLQGLELVRTILLQKLQPLDQETK